MSTMHEFLGGLYSSHGVIDYILFKFSFFARIKHVIYKNIKENGPKDRSLMYPIDNISQLASLVAGPHPLFSSFKIKGDQLNTEVF